MSQQIHTYVNQLNIPEKFERTVTGIFFSLLSQGALFMSDVCTYVNAYQKFISSARLNQLKSIYEKSKIYIYYTNNNDNNGELNYFKYPMSKLPTFYQLYLLYVAKSNNHVGPFEEPRMTVAYAPNMQLSLDAHAFVPINNTQENPIFLQKGNATFASPVIVDGEEEFEVKLDTFNQSKIYSMPFADIPRICNTPIVNASAFV